MKVLLLGFVRIAHMPYMYDYVRLLGGSNELHLVSWNRNGRPDAPVPKGISKSFVFGDHVEDADPIQKKLPHFARFRKFALGVIDSEGYDRIVVLHSTPGITILDRLKGDFRGRYILDYRDVSHESLGFYRKLILLLSRNAGLVLASSPAFFRYLDNASGVMLKHNLLASECPPRMKEFSEGTPIRVRYWGMIRHERANIAMIDALGGDERFELHYNGREEEVAERLKAHVAEHGFHNVYFHGAYYAEERAYFAAETDIVHNVYENDSVMVGAMSNKYYDAVQYGIPQVCTQGSIMGDEVKTKGLGLAVDYEAKGLADAIYEYYCGLDRAVLDKACADELASVRADNNAADAAIRAFFGME